MLYLIFSKIYSVIDRFECYILLAMPRVETRGSENEEESKQRC